MKSLSEREQLFVALGAAIGSNCVPCVETILPKAQAAGIEDWELQLALNAADFVRRKPAKKVLSTAQAIVNGVDDEPSKDSTCPLDPIERAPATEADVKAGAKASCCG